MGTALPAIGLRALWVIARGWAIKLSQLCVFPWGLHIVGDAVCVCVGGGGVVCAPEGGVEWDIQV